MKSACSKCGDEWEPRWIWSGLCVDCWFEDHEEPATALPGTDLQAKECVFCGRGLESASGEICDACDPVVRT